MNSRNLKKQNRRFSNWYKLSCDNEEDLLNALPRKPGIYMIKSNKSFGRFFRNSDIVYIGGSRRRKGGLRERFREYLHPGPTQRTAQRINKWISEYPNMFKISFLLKNGECVLRSENELLCLYEQEHGELPPFNRNVGISKTQKNKHKK